MQLSSKDKIIKLEVMLGDQNYLQDRTRPSQALLLHLEYFSGV